MVIGPIQIVFGLYVDTNKMTIGITQEYRQQVKSMLNDNWTSKRRFFRAGNMQKLIGKIARLGEGAPWIFKLMSHIYVNPHMRTISLCVMGSPNANFSAIPARLHMGIPICIRRSPYANLHIWGYKTKFPICAQLHYAYGE